MNSVATGYIMETFGVGALSSPRGADQRDRDAAYIAALSPDVVKALVARVERAEAAMAGLVGLVEIVSGRDDMPASIKSVLATNHRIVTARETLAALEAK